LSATRTITLNQTAGSLRIGGFYNATFQNLYKGDIAELLVLSSSVSSTDRQHIECYLAGRYGITLRGSHSCSNGVFTATLTDTTNVSGTVTLAAHGGRKPYTFSIVSGNGSVDAATGVFTASATPGSTSVLVRDAAGATRTIQVDVTSFPRPYSWFKADTLTGYSGGATVNHWPNSIKEQGSFSQLSGSAPQYATSGTINGLPALRFAGTNYYSSPIQLPGASAPRTMIVVAKGSDPSIAADQYILGYGNATVTRALYSIAFRTASTNRWAEYLRTKYDIPAAPPSDG
jgi:hypothetical protein